MTHAKPAGPPRDEQIERALLGSILLDPRLLQALLADDRTRPSDFYAPLHRRIWEVFVDLWLSNLPVDTATVASRTSELANGVPAAGVGFLIDLVAESACGANTGYYADKLRGLATRRLVFDLGPTISKAACEADTHEAAVEQAQSAVMAISERQAHSNIRGAAEVVASAYDRVKRIHEGEPQAGLLSGFAALDAVTHGLQPEHLIVIGGRASMGKTSFGLTLAQRSKARCLVFSLEMSADELGLRLLALESGVSMDAMRSGQVADHQWAALAKGAAAFENNLIRIDPTGAHSISAIRMRARLEHARSPLALVVVDYLQLVVCPGERREEEVAGVSRGLKALAKELKVPVLALAQLNRYLEQREDKRPQLSDLRDSGAIEQDADVIMFLYRDEYYKREKSKDPGVAEINVAKQRNGPTATIRLAFDRPCAAFRELPEDMQAALPLKAPSRSPSPTRSHFEPRETEVVLD